MRPRQRHARLRGYVAVFVIRTVCGWPIVTPIEAIANPSANRATTGALPS